VEGIVSKNVEAPYRLGRNEAWLKINVSDRRLREGRLPASRRCLSPSGGGRTVGKVGTGFNRKSSMEIRKKLDAILSSKSRLAKAPHLKGATWALRADR
jgi:ATP-dependent DNA ligase